MAAGSLPSYVLYNKLLGMISLIVTYEVIARSLHSLSAESVMRSYVAIGSVWNLIGLGALALWHGGSVLTPMIYNPGREDRLMGLLMDPNAYGGFVASVFVVQLGLLVFGSHRSRLEWVNVLLLIAGLMVSRVPTLSLKGLNIARGNAVLIAAGSILLIGAFFIFKWVTMIVLCAIYLATVLWAALAASRRHLTRKR